MVTPNVNILRTAKDTITIDVRVVVLTEGNSKDLLKGKAQIKAAEVSAMPVDLKLQLLGSPKDLDRMAGQ